MKAEKRIKNSIENKSKENRTEENDRIEYVEEKRMELKENRKINRIMSKNHKSLALMKFKIDNNKLLLNIEMILYQI